MIQILDHETTNPHVLFAIIILLSGCNIGTGSYQQPHIDFSGSLQVSEDGFTMQGEIVNLENHPTRFENISVYLYSANETLIRAVPVGTLERRQNISVTTDQIPEYIIIWSPEFWQAGWLSIEYYTGRDSVDYYERVEAGPGNYTVHTAGSPDDLPVQPDEE